MLAVFGDGEPGVFRPPEPGSRGRSRAPSKPPPLAVAQATRQEFREPAALWVGKDSRLERGALTPGGQRGDPSQAPVGALPAHIQGKDRTKVYSTLPGLQPL